MTKEKRNSLLIKIGLIAAAVLVVGLCVYNALFNSGTIQRTKIAAASENYSVDAVMFSYYYAEQLQNYSSVISYMGIDTSKSLKSQPCAYLTEGGSWFDYFVKTTRDYVGNMLTLCEIAKKNGVDQLSEDENASIESQLESVRTVAKAYSVSADSYLSSITSGNPVKLKDVKKCLELTEIARKGYNYLMDSFTYTDADYDAYAEENASSLMGVDACIYTFYSTNFRVTDADENPTSTAEEESAAAEEAAGRLAAVKTADEFDSVLRDILTEIGADEETIESSVKKAHVTHGTVTEIGTDAEAWAESAAAGDTMIVGETGDTSFTAYLLTKPSYRDETKTRNVRHILFLNTTYEDSSKADEVYAEWEAAGFTEEKFIELCGQYSEDPGSKEVGGLYEDVAPGKMVEEFDEWLFDSSRKPGDHALIESADYGWHIMYYVGEGDLVAWKVTAESSMKQDDYQKALTDNAANLTISEKIMSSISG